MAGIVFVFSDPETIQNPFEHRWRGSGTFIAICAQSQILDERTHPTGMLFFFAFHDRDCRRSVFKNENISHQSSKKRELELYVGHS
jgi:hypothetical protein